MRVAAEKLMLAPEFVSYKIVIVLDPLMALPVLSYLGFECVIYRKHIIVLID